MEIRRLREQRRIDPLISTTPIQLPLYNTESQRQLTSSS